MVQRTPREPARACARVCVCGEHTGRATIMLSYTWGYTFGAIGSALMAFCAKDGLDPRTTHVWICCMCINQHRVAGGPAGANRASVHSAANRRRHLRRHDGDAGGAEARVREPRELSGTIRPLTATAQALDHPAGDHHAQRLRHPYVSTYPVVSRCTNVRRSSTPVSTP